MFRRRDHERFIGSYDPEHEMPNPDRDPRERYQSDNYRHNARDSRFMYRMDPDRFEERVQRGRGEWDRGGYSRPHMSYGGPRNDYDRGERQMSYGNERNYGSYGGSNYGGSNYGNSNYGGGSIPRGSYGDRSYEGGYDRSSRNFGGSHRGYDRDYGWDRNRDDNRWNEGGRYGAPSNDRDRYAYGSGDDRWDRSRNFSNYDDRSGSSFNDRFAGQDYGYDFGRGDDDRNWRDRDRDDDRWSNDYRRR